MNFILHVLIRLTVDVSELIIPSLPCEFHRSLLMTLYMPYVTFDNVTRSMF
jgi:hypothetical protein